jgi:hypothetical protein
MRVKIVSDGVKSRVLDADTGREIEGVVHAEWDHQVDKIPVAIIRVVEPVVDLEARGFVIG